MFGVSAFDLQFQNRLDCAKHFAGLCFAVGQLLLYDRHAWNDQVVATNLDTRASSREAIVQAGSLKRAFWEKLCLGLLALRPRDGHSLRRALSRELGRAAPNFAGDRELHKASLFVVETLAFVQRLHGGEDHLDVHLTVVHHLHCLVAEDLFSAGELAHFLVTEVHVVGVGHIRDGVAYLLLGSCL